MTAPEPLFKSGRETWKARAQRWVLYGNEGDRNHEIGMAILRYEDAVAALESQLSRRETADTCDAERLDLIEAAIGSVDAPDGVWADMGWLVDKLRGAMAARTEYGS